MQLRVTLWPEFVDGDFHELRPFWGWVNIICQIHANKLYRKSKEEENKLKSTDTMVW